MATTRVPCSSVVFRVDSLGEDDRALLAELFDQYMIARGEIDVVARVAAARGAHVLGVEGILEREDDPIHRHLFEIRIASVGRVEFDRTFERVRHPTQYL